jgi:uncharacterized membrane-anchored protein
MTTEQYKKTEEWGVFIYACLVIAYIFLNILFHNYWTKGQVSGWIFFGPLLIFPFAAFFISMRLVSGTEPADESDQEKTRDKCAALKASVAGFIIWLIVLVLLERIQAEINVFLSLICGGVLIMGINRLLNRTDSKGKPE